MQGETGQICRVPGDDKDGPVFLLMRRAGFLPPHDVLRVPQQEFMSEIIYEWTCDAELSVRDNTPGSRKENCSRTDSFGCVHLQYLSTITKAQCKTSIL